MENPRKHRDIKLVTTETGTNYLVSEPNYLTTKFFGGNSFTIEMKKTEIFTNILQKILKLDLILQIINCIGRYLKEKIKKSN